MRSIERRPRNGQARRNARYRDPTGCQLLKVFTREVEGQRFRTTVGAAGAAAEGNPR